MEWINRARAEWPAILILVILFLGAFAVPLVGPLRSSGSRTLIAAAVLLVGIGVALLVELSWVDVPPAEGKAPEAAPEG